MSPTGTARGRSRVMPYGMDAFMLGIGMLGYPGFQAASYASRGYTGLAPGYTYQFPEDGLLSIVRFNLSLGSVPLSRSLTVASGHHPSIFSWAGRPVWGANLPVAPIDAAPGLANG
eukprot:g45981.t1